MNYRLLSIYIALSVAFYVLIANIVFIVEKGRFPVGGGELLNWHLSLEE